MAAVLLYGYSVLPAILISAFLIHFTASMSTFSSVGVAIGNTLEAFLGAYLIQRFIHTKWPLNRPIDLIKFVLLGPILCTLVSAAIGVLSLSLASEMPWTDFFTLIRIWWLGDMFGILVVTPFILAWSRKPKALSPSQVLEATLLGIVLLVFCQTLFGDWFPHAFQKNYPIESLFIPILLWATFRFGQRGVTASILLLATLATWETANGHGIFYRGSPTESIHLLQLFIGTSSITMLMVVAVRMQHRNAQIALKNSEALYQSIVENLPLNFFQKALDGTVLFVNNRYRKLLNRPLEEIIGKTDRDLFPPELAEKYIADDHQIIETARPLETYEEKHKLANGDDIYVEVVKAPVKDSTNKVVGIAGAFWDVTERKIAEEKLVLAKQLSDEANLAKSKFLANMSHEIRTPLGAILGFVEKMESPKLTDAQRRHGIERIRRNVRSLTELIDDILDLSKVEAGKLRIEKIPFNLLVELGDIYLMLKDRASEKDLYLYFRFDGAIPRKISTDPTRLRQVLLNVIGNAIKFTQVGGVTVTISLIQQGNGHPSQKLRFSVTDTGCGIDPSQQKQLFRPFSQADSSTTRKYGGTGLGLILSRRLGRALGGEVSLVHSALGVGSTFELEVATGPINHVEMVTNITEAQLTKEPAVPFDATKHALDDMDILVVEDGADNQELLEYFLSTSGAHVEIAVNGQEAVQYASKKKYDVILMDIQMPVLDGYAATRQLRKQGYHKPIVALTAHAMIEEKKKCFDVGCDGYITKPVTRDTLVQVIQQFQPHTLTPYPNSSSEVLAH